MSQWAPRRTSPARCYNASGAEGAGSGTVTHVPTTAATSWLRPPNGVNNTDYVPIIHFMTVTVLNSGGAAATVVMQIKDGSGNVLWAATQSVAAGTTDAIHIEFPFGLAVHGGNATGFDPTVLSSTPTVLITYGGTGNVVSLSLGVSHVIATDLY